MFHAKLVSEKPMHVVAPEKASTCRSKSAKGEWVEKVQDYVSACNSLKGKISQMKVMEDFESKPHKAVSFVVEREKEMQERSEQKLPKVLPGYSGGWLPGRSTREKRQRSGRRGEWRKNNQESSRSKSGCRHQRKCKSE